MVFHLSRALIPRSAQRRPRVSPVSRWKTLTLFPRHSKYSSPAISLSGVTIKRFLTGVSAAVLCMICCASLSAQSKSAHNPTWWAKYQYLSSQGASSGGGATNSLTVGGNVDVSNECGPQSETYITLNAARSKNLAAGSNEI